MNLTKRRLLAILSLELLLYSFLYFPMLLIIGLTMAITQPTEPAQRLGLLALAVGPPFAWLALNAWIAAALVRKGPFSERNWATMRFALKLMGLQAVLIALTFVIGQLNIVAGCLAITGLIAAAFMKSEPA